MRGLIALLLAACVLAAAPDRPAAQQAVEVLRGIRTVQLVFEALDEHSRNCGLRREDLVSLVQGRLTRGGLAVLDDMRTADARIYVRANTAYLSRSEVCATNLTFEVFSYHTVRVPHSTRRQFARVVYWDIDNLVATSQDRHHVLVLQTLEEECVRFLEEWAAVNP